MNINNDVTPPASLVQDKKCYYGCFNQPANNVNLIDLPIKKGIVWPEWFRNFRLKRWQAIQLSQGDWFFCIALYNTGLVMLSLIMAYNRHTKKKFYYEHKCSPLNYPKRSNLEHCELSYDGKDYFNKSHLMIKIGAYLKEKRFHVSFKACGFKNQPDLEGDFEAIDGGEVITSFYPLVNDLPFYSCKLLMPVKQSKLLIDHCESSDSTLGELILDDHQAYYPYKMAYDWVTAFGRNEKGLLFGINLTANQSKYPDKWNENAIWLDGHKYALGKVKFEHINNGQLWKVTDDKTIDITFKPEVFFNQKKQALIVAVDYIGTFGRLSGTVVTHSREIHFDNLFGMGEKKYIRL